MDVGWVLYWVSPTGQGSINLGGFASREQALDAIPGKREELKGLLSEEFELQAIDNGSFEVRPAGDEAPQWKPGLHNPGGG